MSAGETQLDVKLEGEPLEALSAAWCDTELSLGQRARALSRYFTESRLTLEGAARFLDASPAELQALVGLATVSDEDLAKISEANPPKTTWLFFAEAETEEIDAGLAALLDAAGPDEEMAAKRVYDAMREVAAPTLDDRVAAISGTTLGHLASKAKQYDVLSPKARKFLVDLCKRKRLGGSLTERQLEWLKGILIDLVDREVVRRDSPDGDQEQCDEVLNALGQ